MRERTTWNRDQIVARVAANSKVAEDPRAMNQDHLSQQPAADKYEIGGPSDFAEDVHPSGGTWKAEYSGGEVKRNEIGMPEMRGDTFNHAEKTAAQQQEEDELLEKKADLCIKLARKVLTKTASESMIEDQALAFMHLPDAALIESVNRLAAEEDEQDEQQSKQAQQQQAEEEQKKQAQQQQAQEDEQKKQAQAQQQQQQAEEEQKKQAQQQQQQAEEEQKKQAQQQQADQGDDEQKKQAALAAFKSACDAMAQAGGMQLSQQQLQDQVMALFQQAMGGQQQVQQQQGDDQLLDQMLQDDGQQPVFAGLEDIQLEGASMDTGETRLASEDEVLSTLFASHDEVRQANHANALQGISAPVVASQGSTRTASTRTVGTRPTAGVSTLGSGSNASSGGDIDKLSNLWASAPDVKGVFG